MNVENGLTSRFTAVEDEPVLPVGVLGGKLCRRRYDLGEKERIALCQLGNVGVLGRLRDHKQVDRSLRRNVAKRDQAFAFEDDLGRNFARDNELEDGGLAR